MAAPASMSAAVASGFSTEWSSRRASSARFTAISLLHRARGGCVRTASGRDRAAARFPASYREPRGNRRRAAGGVPPGAGPARHTLTSVRGKSAKRERGVLRSNGPPTAVADCNRSSRCENGSLPTTSIHPKLAGSASMRRTTAVSLSFAARRMAQASESPGIDERVGGTVDFAGPLRCRGRKRRDDRPGCRGAEKHGADHRAAPASSVAAAGRSDTAVSSPMTSPAPAL